MSNLQLILDALDKYAEQTGVSLKDNPFAEHVFRCDSPDAVLQLLQENVKEFKEYRDKNRKFIDCLNPVVKFVHAFSGVLGEAAGDRMLVSEVRLKHQFTRQAGLDTVTFSITKWTSRCCEAAT